MKISILLSSLLLVASFSLQAISLKNDTNEALTISTTGGVGLSRSAPITIAAGSEKTILPQFKGTIEISHAGK